MAEEGVQIGSREFVVDACERCLLFWFDFDELEALPRAPPPPRPSRLSPPAAEAAARLDVRTLEVRAGAEDEPSAGESIAGALGLASKRGAPARASTPWLTWAVATAILVLIGVLTVVGWSRRGLEGAPHEIGEWAKAWGFVPAEASRHGGLTWVTSFFLHGSWWHAFGNAYFLVLTGEDIEGLLGRIRYAGLLLAGALASCAFDYASSPQRSIPAIGASGGIAALFGWYACALPRVIVKSCGLRPDQAATFRDFLDLV